MLYEMDYLQNLAEINWFDWFIILITILLAYKFIVSLFDWFVDKLGLETKAMRQKREDHELLVKTSQGLIALQDKHDRDDKKLEECISTFIEETRKENDVLREEMRQFTENRIHDREQSFAIQKELTNSIRVVAESQVDRDQKIEALMCGSKELLGDTIDQRFDKYVELHGIPQTEVDEFDAIYEAYAGLKGNHGREFKYKYVKENLPVIPVSTKLMLEEK